LILLEGNKQYYESLHLIYNIMRLRIRQVFFGNEYVSVLVTDDPQIGWSQHDILLVVGYTIHSRKPLACGEGLV